MAWAWTGADPTESLYAGNLPGGFQNKIAVSGSGLTDSSYPANTSFSVFWRETGGAGSADTWGSAIIPREHRLFIAINVGGGGGSGEVNMLGTLGGGESIDGGKAGPVLNTKSLTGSNGIAVTSSATEVNHALTYPLTADLGTVAAPSYSFTGDTNTGLYSPGADQVAVSSGGVQRLLVNGDLVTVTADLAVTGDAGATPAGAGCIRMPNGEQIRVRNNADTGDFAMLFTDANDVIQIGGSSAGGVKTQQCCAWVLCD